MFQLLCFRTVYVPNLLLVLGVVLVTSLLFHRSFVRGTVILTFSTDVCSFFQASISL